MRSDYLSLGEIESNCTCAGIFLIKHNTRDTYSKNEISVLLVESRRKNYQYSFPKGKRNKNENTMTAAKRELQEETGISENDYSLIPDKFYIEYRTDNNKPHIIYYLAYLTNFDKELKPEDTREIVSANWFDPLEIYKMKKSFYLQRRQIVTRAVRDYWFFEKMSKTKSTVTTTKTTEKRETVTTTTTETTTDEVLYKDEKSIQINIT